MKPPILARSSSKSTVPYKFSPPPSLSSQFQSKYPRGFIPASFGNFGNHLFSKPKRPKNKNLYLMLTVEH